MSDKKNGSRERWRVFSRLRALRDKPLAAEVLGCSLAALMLVGFFLNSGEVRKRVRNSRQMSRFIHSDNDFYKTPPLLGGDYRLVSSIRKSLPPGTTIAVAACSRSKYPTPILGRRQRFWLALLPQYPIGPSPLVICPSDQVTPADRLIQRGQWFALIRREPDVETEK